MGGVKDKCLASSFVSFLNHLINDCVSLQQNIVNTNNLFKFFPYMAAILTLSE